MSTSANDDLRARLVAIFKEEAADHLRSIAKEMAELERQQEEEAALATLDALFRTVHTLKGAARSLAIRPVEQRCHEIEDLCSDLVHRRAPFDADARGMLREMTERLAEDTSGAIAASPAPPARDAIVASPASSQPTIPAPQAASPEPRAQAVSGAAPAPAETAPAPVPRPSPAPATAVVAPSFVRVETGHIQRLGLLAEDLLAPRLAAQARVEEARRVLDQVGALRRDQRALERVAGPEAAAPSLAAELKALEDATRRLVTGLMEDNRGLRLVTDALAVDLRRARMMPAAELLAVFPAMVADLAREVGKTIAWRTSGAELQIDRQVAELIKDPLIQIVRNAIDHGIEAPQARLAAGKPERGAITLAIEPADGGRLAIEVSDDGAGIDAAAIREAAVRSRMLSAEQAREMAEADVLDLVFQSNLSTRGVISAVSGRGLGLAIVRERVERLGGSAHLHSVPGAGTTLRLEVPAALANFRGIGVKVGGAAFVWPRDAVERTIALGKDDYILARDRGVMQLNGDVVAFTTLAQVLEREGADPVAPSGLASCLVIRHGGRRAVVAVDEVTGECEVVVKELRHPLLRVRHVLAVGLLGSGQLAVILRTQDILEAMAQRPERARAAATAQLQRAGKHRLLIVDDSLTTRAMEAGLLEAAGYEVEAAANGLEAWAALQSRPFDAVVSDVDMPSMDGFELTEKIRSDPRLKQLPIVLVTALERREDHERGIRLGANAYMMKSAFDQSLLIDLVRRVL